MARYSNSDDGLCFDEQCSKCMFGERICPIARAQLTYNYEQHGNQLAIDILEMIISNKNGCEMFHTFKKELSVRDPNQEELF